MDASTPRNVRFAVNLLWISASLVAIFAAAVLVGLVDLPGEARSPIFDVITNLLTIGVLVLIALKVSVRKNWARWLLVVIAGLGLLAGAFSIAVLPEVWRSASFLLYLSGIVQTLLQLGAAVLLFTPQARPWFRNERAAV